MGEYTEECINTFLMNQGQLFDEPVAENYDEAEPFWRTALQSLPTIWTTCAPTWKKRAWTWKKCRMQN